MSDTKPQVTIQSFYDAVSKGWPNFKIRDGQRQMVESIARTFELAKPADSARDGANLIVVQAQTGTGKTIGYTIPGIVVAKAQKKRLIISTGTIALQEQLILRDLPALAKISPIPFTYALAKGRNRYACSVKLEDIVMAGSQTGMFGPDDDEEPKPTTNAEAFRTILLKLERKEWNGDRDSLDDPAVLEQWAQIGADRHTCTGRNCPRFASCPYFSARKELADADVIVANHDLVLAALSTDAKVLPSPEECIYVFDEGHHLPEVAISRFSSSHDMRGALNWLGKLPAVLQRSAMLLPEGQSFLDLIDHVSELGTQFRSLNNALGQRQAFGSEPVWRFEHGVMPEGFEVYAQAIQEQIVPLLEGAVNLQRSLMEERKESGNKEALDKALRDLGVFAPRLESMYQVWSQMNSDDDPPIAKWIERQARGNGHDFVFCTAPISAAKALASHVWDQVGAAAVTSATIKALGSFDYYLRNAGLTHYDKASTLDVASPFDYANQGVFVVPAMKTSPTDSVAHTAELCQMIPEEIAGISHGGLVLFTSKKQMQEVYAALPPALAKDVLMQGTMPRPELLGEHRKRVDSGRRSILFGMASFGEGLDLPGALCETVIIAKLPFAPPDSPIEEARAEYLEKQRRNPFAELSVPAVGIKMQQWTGRAIRSELDTARIVCLDTRLQTKSYGAKILAGLPPFRREIGCRV